MFGKSPHKKMPGRFSSIIIYGSFPHNLNLAGSGVEPVKAIL